MSLCDTFRGSAAVAQLPVKQLVVGSNPTRGAMEIITRKISVIKLKELSKRMFGNLVKVVVDIEKGVMAIDGELHADEQALLLENGSKQENLWGANIYPDKTGEDFIEFDSVINIRPSQQNRSRGVDNLETRKVILEIINKLIEK